MKTNDSTEDAPSVREVCLFLSEYASLLLGCGATCLRLQKNVDRMAGVLGCRAVMTILPRHIHTTVCADDGSETYTYASDTRKHGISFDINTRLSRLSWEIADGRIGFEEAVSRLGEIAETPPAPKGMVLFLVSLANASFCHLFGGDWPAVGVVFAATFAGFYLRQVLCGCKTDSRVVFMVCAFVSSVLAAGAALFNLGETPEIAVGTSVLYLVPGIPFLNSFSDLLAGHYICSFCRLMDALILTASLSIGLCGGLLMMNLGMF